MGSGGFDIFWKKNVKFPTPGQHSWSKVSKFPTLRQAKVGCTPQIATNFPTLGTSCTINIPTQGTALTIKFPWVAPPPSRPRPRLGLNIADRCIITATFPKVKTKILSFLEPFYKKFYRQQGRFVQVMVWFCGEIGVFLTTYFVPSLMRA